MRDFARIIFALVITLSVFCVSPNVIAEPVEQGTVMTIDCPEAVQTRIREVNARGEMVGRYWSEDGTTHALLLTKDGECLPLDIPGAVNSRAMGVNASGDIVGRAGGPEIGVQSFLMKSNGELMFFSFPLDPSLYTWQMPNDINAAGDIVGFWGESGDHLPPPNWTEHGYLRTRHGEFITIDFPGSALTNLRGINESGDMVGLYAPDHPGGPYFGFLYRDGEFISLEDYFGTANGINPQGQIVGKFVDDEGRHVGILDGDAFTVFDVPGLLLEPWKINPSGFVSGFYRGDDGLNHGFIRTPDR